MRSAVAIAGVLAVAGCYQTHDVGIAPAGPCSEGEPPELPVCSDSSSCLDVLVVMDNRASMVEEQITLFDVMQRFLREVVGDLDGDGSTDATPIARDVHFAVVTGDLGSGGTFVDGCLSPDRGDDGIMGRGRVGRLHPSCGLDIPPISQVGPGDDLVSFVHDAACSLAVGIYGCPFEQTLDATIKSLVASTARVSFHAGSCGHGDMENHTFLRGDSELLVVIATDHDDCSVADPAFFAELGDPPPEPAFACNGDPRLHPIARYASALRDVRGSLARTRFAVVAGAPPDLVRPTSEPVAWDPLSSDPRMAETSLRPSCTTDSMGEAYPPRRLVQAAQSLEASGALSTVASICEVAELDLASFLRR